MDALPGPCVTAGRWWLTLAAAIVLESSLSAQTAPIAPGAAGATPLDESAPVVAWETLDSRQEEDGRRRWLRDGEPFSGAVVRTADRGWEQSATMRDGYEHGLSTLRYDDGRRAREVAMVDGREHGVARMWYGSGRPYVLEYSRAGEPHGPHLLWSATGELERLELRVQGGEVPLSLDGLSRWSPEGVAAPEAHVDFWRAVVQAREGRSRDALQTLQKSFAAGYPTPSDAIGLGVLAALAADPATRPGLVQSWLDHARESELVIASPQEPGPRLLLDVVVLDARTERAIPGAGFRMHHTDRTGEYFPEETKWNVRLYAAGRATAEGRLRFHTILPGYYHERHDPEGAVPRHVHFVARAPGYRSFGGEAHFSDDPRAGGDAAALLVEMTTVADEPLRGTLVVRLEPE